MLIGLLSTSEAWRNLLVRTRFLVYLGLGHHASLAGTTALSAVQYIKDPKNTKASSQPASRSQKRDI